MKQRGLAEFEQAAAQDPSYAEAHFNIGMAYWKAGKTGNRPSTRSGSPSD
jgi:hypothetical protein